MLLFLYYPPPLHHSNFFLHRHLSLNFLRKRLSPPSCSSCCKQAIAKPRKKTLLPPLRAHRSAQLIFLALKRWSYHFLFPLHCHFVRARHVISFVRVHKNNGMLLVSDVTAELYFIPFQFFFYSLVLTRSVGP